MKPRETGDLVLGHVPRSWRVASLRRVLAMSSGGSPPDEEGPYPVYGSNGPIGTAPSYNITEKRIVIGRVGTSGVVNIAPAFTWISDNALIVRIRRPDLLAFRYAVYVLRTLRLDEQASKTAQPLITSTMVLSRRMGLPPLGTQRAIADFLDHKTATIDDLIAKKERLIELLEEKRAALINQAVTKGLDPNVPMKDSGIPWIGEIPAHWDVRRLKFLVSEVVDCLHSTPPYSDQGEYPAIRTADIMPGILDYANARKVHREAYLDRVRRSKPRGGDIIYSREGERFGMAAPVPDGVDLCLAQRVMQLRPRRRIASHFLMWALNSHAVYHQAWQDTVGATSPRVNMETVANMWIAVPPRNEQVAIASHVAADADRVQRIAGALEQQIDLLSEYRQALITAAVTGQLDVDVADGEVA